MSEFAEAVRVLGLRRTLYLRFAYPYVQRFTHRYGWHHAPETKLVGGEVMRWCQWCGLREVRRRMNPPALSLDENEGKNDERAAREAGE